MDLAGALVVLRREIARSSLRAVAKRMDVPHSTVNGWLTGKPPKTPEGERLRVLLEWAEGQPVPPVVDVPATPLLTKDQEAAAFFNSAFATTQETLRQLRQITGYAKLVRDSLIDLAKRQQSVVGGLEPWAQVEESAEAARERAELIEADKTLVTPTAAAPARPKKRGQQ